MIRTLILSILLIFILAARGTGPLSPEAIDRHYLSVANDNEGLLQSESMIRQSLGQTELLEPLTWRLARTYQKLGDRAPDRAAKIFYGRCIEQADRVIQINSQSAWGYFYRAVCSGKLGEIQGIWKSLTIIKPLKKDLLSAVKFDGSVAEGGPHRALGKLYLELPGLLGGNVDKSVDHLKQAVELGPGFAENYLFLAEALFEKESYRSARNTLETLLEITNKSAEQPQVKTIRQQAHELMEKIKPWIDSQDSDAQRNKN